MREAAVNTSRPPKAYRQFAPKLATVINFLRLVGEAEGRRQNALEVAHKLRERGIAWRIVTEATGVKPSNLRSLAKQDNS